MTEYLFAILKNYYCNLIMLILQLISFYIAFNTIQNCNCKNYICNVEILQFQLKHEKVSNLFRSRYLSKGRHEASVVKFLCQTLVHTM